MTIERAPHPIYSAIWLVRFLLLLTAHMMPERPWFGFVVAMSFFPIEAAGIFSHNGYRDQMSEIITWILRTLSKHEIAFRGWNNLALIIALIEGAMVYKLMTTMGGLPLWLAGPITISLVVMLHDHWLAPQRHG